MRLRSGNAYNFVTLTSQRWRPQRSPSRHPRRTSPRLSGSKSGNGVPGPRKCMPERAVRGGSRITKWPPRLRRSGPRGLNNPASYCYRRSLLQCLLHLPAFYNYLGSIHKNCDKTTKECTTCALQALMQKYWNDGTQEDFPKAEDGGAVGALDQAVNSSCPPTSAFHEFTTATVQGDPHEFLLYLIDQLLTVENDLSDRLDQLFTMKHSVRWTCEDCNGEHAHEDTNVGLVLGVRSCKGPEKLSLMGYLCEYHTDPAEIFCHGLGCEASRQLESDNGQESARTTKEQKRNFIITQASEVLCVELKRGAYKQVGGHFMASKIGDDVPFPEELDLSEFTEDENSLKYRLYGVVAHRGPNINSGHYIAAVRRQDDEGFRTISDSDIERPEDDSWEELRYPMFNDAHFDPLLLFYLKV